MGESLLPISLAERFYLGCLTSVKTCWGHLLEGQSQHKSQGNHVPKPSPLSEPSTTTPHQNNRMDFLKIKNRIIVCSFTFCLSWVTHHQGSPASVRREVEAFFLWRQDLRCGIGSIVHCGFTLLLCSWRWCFWPWPFGVGFH